MKLLIETEKCELEIEITKSKGRMANINPTEALPLKFHVGNMVNIFF